MKNIRRIGTAVLCMIIALGFLLVTSIVVSYHLRIHGISNRAINILIKNVSISTPISQLWGDSGGKYTKPQSFPEKIESFAVGIKDNLESFATGAIPGNRYFKSASDYFRQRIMRCNIVSIPGGKTNQEYAEEAFKEIQQFSEFAKLTGIDFLYVQTPSITRIEDAHGISGNTGTESDLDLYNSFSNLLEQSDVPFLNLCDDTDFLKSVSLDISDHWTPADALYASAQITATLNSLYGFDFDTRIYDLSKYQNALLEAPDILAAIQDEFGYTYEFLVPSGQTLYSVTENDDIIIEGSFLETLVSPKEDWDRRTDDGSALIYHNMWRLRNGTFLDIVNLDSFVRLAGKKVLILGDSFSWPISAYLSQDISELVAMHPRYFDGDVRTFVDYYKPDLIIWIYVESQVGNFNRQNFSVVNQNY